MEKNSIIESFKLETVGVPSKIDLKKINSFALKDLKKEDVFTFEGVATTNAFVNRGEGRIIISSSGLKDIAKSLKLGQSLQLDHNDFLGVRRSFAVGKSFSASVEKGNFNEDGAKFSERVIAKYYIIRDVEIDGVKNNDIIKNIEGGVFNKLSIGFNYSSTEECEDKEGSYLSLGNIECAETSIVFKNASAGSLIKKLAQEVVEGTTNLKDIKVNYPSFSFLSEGVDEVFEIDKLVSLEVEKAKKGKNVIAYKKYKLADKGAKWDAGVAKENVAKWASADGSGDKDKIDFKKYKEAFTWCDASNQEDVGSYKFPHHDVIDKELVTIWNGVKAGMGALKGARGGVGIPEEDKKGVYDHLSKHYTDFDEKPPEFKETLDIETDIVKDTGNLSKTMKDDEKKDEIENKDKGIENEELEEKKTEDIKEDKKEVEEKEVVVETWKKDEEKDKEKEDTIDNEKENKDEIITAKVKEEENEKLNTESIRKELKELQGYKEKYMNMSIEKKIEEFVVSEKSPVGVFLAKNAKKVVELAKRIDEPSREMLYSFLEKASQDCSLMFKPLGDAKADKSSDESELREEYEKTSDYYKKQFTFDKFVKDRENNLKK